MNENVGRKRPRTIVAYRKLLLLQDFDLLLCPLGAWCFGRVIRVKTASFFRLLSVLWETDRASEPDGRVQ